MYKYFERDDVIVTEDNIKLITEEEKIFKLLDKNKKRIIKSNYPASEIIDIFNENNVLKDLSIDYYRRLRKYTFNWTSKNDILINFANFI